MDYVRLFLSLLLSFTSFLFACSHMIETGTNTVSSLSSQQPEKLPDLPPVLIVELRKSRWPSRKGTQKQQRPNNQLVKKRPPPPPNCIPTWANCKVSSPQCCDYCAFCHCRIFKTVCYCRPGNSKC
ncbi:agouti signaling protein 1 isoform X1 [Latimeria chalumnae]|uniref:agouti signaling protein 1 isoform X1 n=1 Tax=Latimeria chalumnae TaxID=7897 RepID=UPI0003C1A82D|nr:PREDICTED: agouti-signaling protein [Latimeria chalumnae]|eukprot:XP_005986820.1 PREDICTED: agouti-signaling protein [Latimeria chalumnae]